MEKGGVAAGYAVCLLRTTFSVSTPSSCDETVAEMPGYYKLIVHERRHTKRVPVYFSLATAATAAAAVCSCGSNQFSSLSFSRLFLSLSFYLSLLFFSIFGLLLFVFFFLLAAPSSLGCSGDQLLLTRMKCAVTCSLPNSRNVFYELIWLPEGCLLPSPPNRRTCGSTISRHKEEEDQRNFLLTLYFSGFSFFFHSRVVLALPDEFVTI